MRLFTSLLSALSALLLLWGTTSCHQKPEEGGEGSTHKRNAKLKRSASLKLAPYEYYMRALQEKVKAHWHPLAGKENLYGQVLFNINKYGEIEKNSLRLRKSSGDSETDQAMLDTIGKLNLKMRLPGIQPDMVTILFSFNPRLMAASPQEDEGQLKKRLLKINRQLKENDGTLKPSDRGALLFERALLYAALKDEVRSLSDFSQCLSLNYKGEETTLNMGRILFQQKHFSESLASLQKCRQYNPKNLWAELLSACCYQNLGKLDEADKLLEQAEQLARGETFPLAEAFTLSTRAYGANLRGNYKQAIADASKAIELDPWHGPAYTYRADAYDALERKKEALKDYNRALELNSEDLDTHLRRGHLYLEEAHYHQAITDLSEVIKNESTNAQALYFRSCANNQLGLKGQAKSDLLRAQKAGWPMSNMAPEN